MNVNMTEILKNFKITEAGKYTSEMFQNTVKIKGSFSLDGIFRIMFYEESRIRPCILRIHGSPWKSIANFSSEP